MAENAPSAAADPGRRLFSWQERRTTRSANLPPADREARALRGPPWFLFCFRVKSFLCRRPARLCPGYPGAPATPSQDTRARPVSPTDTARQDQPNETTMRFVVCPNHQRSRLRRPRTACFSSIKPRLIFHQPTAGHLPPPQPSRRQSASTGVPRGLLLTLASHAAARTGRGRRAIHTSVSSGASESHALRHETSVTHPGPARAAAATHRPGGARTTTHRKSASGLPSPRPARRRPRRTRVDPAPSRA